MALSPVENMAHHPVRQPNDNPEHRRAERNRIAMRLVALQKERGNRPAHRVSEDKPFSPVAGDHLLLPERSQVINIIAEVHHVPAVSIREQTTRATLTAMVNDHHVKAAVKEIVGHFSILHVAFNAPRANQHQSIVILRAKANKAYRYIIDAFKFSLFALSPEIRQRPHAKGRKRVFSCFPVLFLPKHRVYTPVNR